MSVYQSIYDIINTYIYGGLVTAGSYQDLTCVIVSTIACLFCVAFPFIVVWAITKRLFLRW